MMRSQRYKESGKSYKLLETEIAGHSVHSHIEAVAGNALVVDPGSSEVRELSANRW